MPKLKSVDVSVDLLPERRVATIENAWIPTSEVDPGSEVPVKVFLRPYRGERLEREFKIKVPAGLPKGEHRILLSDADTLNRMQSSAGFMNRFIDLPRQVEPAFSTTSALASWAQAEAPAIRAGAAIPAAVAILEAAAIRAARAEQCPSRAPCG